MRGTTEDPASGPTGPPGQRRLGRRPSTTHADLERIGIDLFSQNGFDATSIEDIAASAGIARRTFFRYFRSKSDVVWGDFDTMLDGMRQCLDGIADDVPMMEALRLAVVDFNALPPEQEAQHRRRLSLILGVPTLIAHSTLRYEQWRRVVADFAARRLGQQPDDLLPHVLGYCALGASLGAYEQWLRHEDADLGALLHRSFGELAVGFDHHERVASPGGGAGG